MPQRVSSEYQKKLIYYVGFSGVAFLTPFGINSLIQERFELTLVIFGLIGFTLFSLRHLYKSNNIKLGQYSITGAVIFMMLYLIMGGGYANTGALWSYPAIIIIVLMLGFSRSLWVIILLVLSSAFILQINPRHIDTYTDSFQIRFLASLTVTALIALIYEYQRDQAERKIVKINEKLKETSRLDPLTNLLNRRAIEAALDKLHAEFNRHQTPFSVIILDIDHFKSINDTYGHTIGDKVLITLANFLTENTRTDDLVARWGGEEFLIILPNTELHDAEFTANKLRYNLKLIDTDKLGTDKLITASFGVATIQHHQSLEELIKLSDNNLYEAKAQGRDRVIS